MLADLGILFTFYCCIVLKHFYIICLSNILILSVSRWRLFHKDIGRSKFDIFVFYYYHLIDTTVGGLLVPEGIILSVVK
jgi:hypothetical protein